MNRILHLVRTDVRHFRWPILLWIVLVGAESVLTGVRPAVADSRAYGNLGMILGLLWSARQIATLLLVPVIIHAHAAVGTDAFWMTRPIPPLTLFAAKALLLGVLIVVVPGLAQVALMLAIHVPTPEALFVGLESALGAAAWLAVLAAGAVVTLNLPRFALLCGAAFLSFVILVTALFMTARIDDGDATATLEVIGSGQPVLPPPDDPTENVLSLVCVAAAGLLVMAVQYRTRLRRVSIPAGVGALTAVAFAIPYWPAPFLQVPSPLPLWAAAGTAARLRADSPQIEMTPATGWMSEGIPSLTRGTSRVIVSGLEPGWVPRLQLHAASVTLENGSSLASRGRGTQSVPRIDGTAEDPARVVARQILGVEHVLMLSPAAPDLAATTLLLPADEIARLPASGDYRAEFAVYLTHWEVAATLPIRAGAAFQADGFRFAIDRVTTAPGHLRVRAREWRATSSFDRKPQIAYAFYARNPQHTHAMAGQESEPFGGMTSFSFGLPFVGLSHGGLERFFTRAAEVVFPPAYGLQGEQGAWEPQWYEGADLAIVRTTEAGAVARSLEIPHASLVAKR